jgi:serine/threonine protein kinase
LPFNSNYPCSLKQKKKNEQTNKTFQVGEGSYGAVYKARDRLNGMEVAVKVLDLQGDDAQAADLRREINILQSCQCKQIVAYGGAYVKDGQLWISMEYCGAGSLSDLMAICETTLVEQEIAAVMYQSLMGLHYLHKTKKIHRDIKSGNILLTDDGICKLADFGVSAELVQTNAKARTMIGTPYFMAPEVLTNQNYDASADIWSMGITAYELAIGQPPFADIHPMRAIFQIPTSPPPRLPDEGQYSKEFREFIECCLQKQPEERLKADQLMKLPFFRDCNSEQKSQRVVLQLLERCKQAIDDWRQYEQEEQQGQNQHTPYNQGGGEEYGTAVDNTSGTMVVCQQQGDFNQFNGATIRRTDMVVAEGARDLRNQSKDVVGYGNDGTVLISKAASPRAQQQDDWDQGTVRVTKPPAPPQNNQGTTHFGSLKVGQKSTASGTMVFTSGTVIARPQQSQQQNHNALDVVNKINESLNTSQNQIGSISPTTTKADIALMKRQIEAKRTQDLNALTLYYEHLLRNLDNASAQRP